MKNYTVIYSDNTKEASEELTKDHINYLNTLETRGDLLLCGMMIDLNKALFIIKAGSKKEVLNLIHRDPFIQTKIYKSFEISEFLVADKNNNFLLDSPSK